MPILPDDPKAGSASPKVVSIDSRQPPWNPEAHVRQWHAFLDAHSAVPNTNQTVEDKARELNQRRWFYYRHRRLLAELLALEWADVPAVQKVIMFGQVALPLKKELARPAEMRRQRFQVWRECPKLQMALWISDLTCVPALRKHRNSALDLMVSLTEVGIAIQALEIYLFDAATGTPIGRAVQHGELIEFRLSQKALDPHRSILLFDRALPETSYRLRDRLGPAVNAALQILQSHRMERPK